MKKLGLFLIATLSFMLFSAAEERIIISGHFTSAYSNKDIISVKTDMGQKMCLPKIFFKSSTFKSGEKFLLSQEIDVFNYAVSRLNYKKGEKRKGRPCRFY